MKLQKTIKNLNFPLKFLKNLAFNVQFDLNPDYVDMLSKSTGFESPYLFIQEFEEVCSLIHILGYPLML